MTKGNGIKRNVICLVLAGVLILSSSSVVVGEKRVSFTQEHAGFFDFRGLGHNNSEHMLGFELFEVFDVDRDGSDDLIIGLNIERQQNGPSSPK